MSVFFTSLDASALRELTMARPEGASAPQPEARARSTSEAAPFAEVLRGVVGEANQALNQADQATAAFSRGEQNDIHGTMIALSQANIRLQLVNEVRNHLLEAYREVMRTSV